MKVEIIGRNYTVNEKLKAIIEQKINKLDRYFENGDTVAKVVLKKHATSLTTEVMLTYTGRLVRATATGENFYDNIDKVLPKLEGQIRKYRTRFDQHQKNSAFKEVALSGDDVENGKIVKEKKFALKPITVNEAIEEMELLGHSFYVFLEAKTNTVQVIYRRSDGDLGLIEPEI